MKKFTLALATIALIAGASSANAAGGVIHVGGYANIDDYNKYYQPAAPSFVAQDRGFSARLDGAAPQIAPTRPHGSAHRFRHRS